MSRAKRTRPSTTPSAAATIGTPPKRTSDVRSISMGRIYTTPVEDAAHIKRTKAAAARNRAQHKRVQPPAAHPARNLWRANTYDPAQDTCPVRPGADDALALPSRIGNMLHYRDGRVVVMGGAA